MSLLKFCALLVTPWRPGGAFRMERIGRAETPADAFPQFVILIATF
jgi:hypothetical protein